MSEWGVFAVCRGVWKHEEFETDAPFSKREAWLWLVSEAAWKDRKKKIAGKSITIERGQLSHSIRFMAEAWNWSKSRAMRFVLDIEKSGMVSTESGTGQIIITICKYNEYQKVALPERDSSGTAAGQQRDKLENNQTNQLSISKEIESGAGVQMNGSSQPSLALGSAPNEPKKRTPRKPNGLAAEYEKEFEEEFWPDWPNKVAKPAGRKGFIKARQRGATLKELIDGRDRYIASKPPGRDWVNPGTFFNQERYADMPAEETLPLVRKDGDSWIVTIGTPEADAHEKRFNAENSSRYYDLHGRPKGTEVRVSTRWPARYN